MRPVRCTIPACSSRSPRSLRQHSAFAPEIPFQLRHQVWRWLSRGKSSGTSESSAPKAPGRLKPLLSQLASRVLCPEPEVLWAPFAIRKARQIVQRYGIEAVLVTAPPFSAFLVGNALKREFPHLKLISDFRDEWLSFYLKDFEFQSSDYTRRRAETIERETVRAVRPGGGGDPISLCAKFETAIPSNRTTSFSCCPMATIRRCLRNSPPGATRARA